MRGSTTAIVQPNGTLIKGYTYDEFGNLAQSGASSFLNEVTFTGSVTDASSGLHYMNARFYQPSTGRFLSQDTYSGNPYDPWTQHLYSYCGNNPVNMIDPTGHKAKRIDASVFDLIKKAFMLASGIVKKNNLLSKNKDDVNVSGVLSDWIKKDYDKLKEVQSDIISISNKQKAGSTNSCSTITYKNESDQLLLEQQTEKVIEDEEEVVTSYDEIRHADYGDTLLEKAVDFGIGLLTRDFSMFSPVEPRWEKNVDYLGRPIYIEKGYTISYSDRIYAGDGNGFSEREVLIFDRDRNEVYHDAYYTSHYCD